MKLSTLAHTIAIATISLLIQNAQASKYNAICVFDELKCGGSIQLREYTPDTNNKCDSGDCAAITTPGATTFSFLPTCADDHVADTEKHLKGKPYVIVETYATGTSCSGDFMKAVAVVANGQCYPTSKVDMSYRVTLGVSDLSVVWKQYSDANCSSNATEVSFQAGEVDRKTCVSGSMKVLAVKPASSGSSASNGSVSSPIPSPTSGSGTIATCAGVGVATIVAALVVA